MGSELFIIGFARSGTTILADIVNTSKQICVLGEANFHFRWEMKDFVYSFNTQHRDSGREVSRGTYLPRAWIGLSAEEVVAELRKNYSVVGSKIAFPPFREHLEMWTQDAVMNFHMQHFYSSKYIFSLREPISSCLSSVKLFPQSTPNGIVFGWLRSLAFQVLGSQVFPHHCFVPLEWMDQEILLKLETILETRFDANSAWLQPPTQAPAVQGRDDSRIADFASQLVLSPDATKSGMEILEEAMALYATLVSWIDRDSLRLNLPGPSVAVIEMTILTQIRDLANQLAGLDMEASNLLVATDNLIDPAWVRGALTVECSVRGADGAPTVFLLREWADEAHKNIMQRYFGHIDEPMVFSIEVKPQGRHRCALQIGQNTGSSFAAFDVKAKSVTIMHCADDIVILDAGCKALHDDWVQCRFIVKTVRDMAPLFISIYILDDDGSFDYFGVESKGMLLRAPKLTILGWPIL